MSQIFLALALVFNFSFAHADDDVASAKASSFTPAGISDEAKKLIYQNDHAYYGCHNDDPNCATPGASAAATCESCPECYKGTGLCDQHNFAEIRDAGVGVSDSSKSGTTKSDGTVH